MIGKYILAGFTHFLFIALCLKILAFFSPFVLISYYYFLGNVLVCAVIAKLTFGVSKHYLLSERINPENKAVLITGAARGIGNFVAKHLDSKGYHVFASCRDAHSPGADDLRKSCSKRLRVLELDVRSDESVKRAAEYVRNNGVDVNSGRSSTMPGFTREPLLTSPASRTSRTPWMSTYSGRYESSRLSSRC
ncbi:estradiol 17-beta-dehydrogenase 2 [Caerostris extrusa]|uniref:Estradiol 17-beta-dehydrogenase 2 n=1 Tax=Caerostris extrusa TaxID=172846 RepID=A0AAV4MIW0_CAEEX|nr:estradiol 17-beta-dehydrogenase 2 [Caerostris extrusa]